MLFSCARARRARRRTRLIDGVFELGADGDRGRGVADRGIAQRFIPLVLPRLRRLVGDVRSLAALHRQHAPLGEPLIGAGDGVRIDAKIFGQVADGRHGRARLQRAEGDHAPDAFLDLAPDGRGVCRIDGEHVCVGGWGVGGRQWE